MSTTTLQTYASLFSSLESGLVAELENKGRLVTAPAESVLLQAGQNIRNTMLVLEGVVKLYRQDEDGNEFFMYYLHPGDACALSMICDRSFKTSTITAKTATDVKLLAIPIDETESWMRQYRTWYHFVVETYRKRYEELLQTIDHIAFKNLDERLEFYLRRHRDTLKTNVLTLNNTEIAQDLNSSREVVSRLLKKLSEQGKVRLLKSGIEIIRL
jgi:CRP/FNR family transcriptional regulator, anaerobic regulatory protein